jgi:hypothetical protein
VPNGLSFSYANGQPDCYNLESKNALPALLIHGWNEGSGGSLPIHWDEWKQKLNQDEIPFCIVSFEQSMTLVDLLQIMPKNFPILFKIS